MDDEICKEESILLDKKRGRFKWKYVGSIIFMLALITLTFFLLFNKYDVKELLRLLHQVKWQLLSLGIALIFLYVIFEGLAMKIILRTFGKKVSLLNNFVYGAIDYYYCAITPSATGGQPMVAYYMKKDGISLSHISLTLLINTALFKVVLLLLSILSLFVYPVLFKGNPLLLTLFIIGFLINVLIISLCFLASFKRNWVEALGKRIIMLLVRIKIIKKPIRWIRIYSIKMEEYEKAGKLLLQHKKQFFLAFFSNLLQRISLFSIGYIVYLSFIPVSPEIVGHSYLQLLAIQVIVSLCVDSLPLPGGVGITEFLYIGLFAVIYQTDNLVASAMLLTRAVTFYIPLVITLIIVIIKQISLFKKKKELVL